MQKNRIFHWGPITALTIITVLFSTSVLTFLIWCPPDDLFGVLHSLIFLTWVINIFHHFFKAMYIGPGHIPFKWKPQEEGGSDYLQFCQPCQGYKAPRSHHCKACKRCVMKMDHHCPWINNCVGHQNHRSFTLFLTFVVIGCSHAACMMIFCVVDHLLWINGTMLLKVNHRAPLRMNRIFIIGLLFGIGLSIGVTIAVGILLFYQMKGILKNETGIESWIVEKARLRPRPEGDIFVYPYDIGMFDNLKQILFTGDDYLGDGITWPVFEDCDQYTLTVEQLEQKDLKRENIITFKAHTEYNGAWFPLAHGFKVCYFSPWSEEDRLSVNIGDTINATRIRRHWLYGVKVQKRDASSNGRVTLPLGECDRQKGWVPRCCVDEFIDQGVTILKKAQ